MDPSADTEELIRRFMVEFEKKGNCDLLYQVPYLSGLAASYAERNDWPSLLRVSGYNVTNCSIPLCNKDIVMRYDTHIACVLLYVAGPCTVQFMCSTSCRKPRDLG